MRTPSRRTVQDTAKASRGVTRASVRLSQDFADEEREKAATGSFIDGLRDGFAEESETAGSVSEAVRAYAAWLNPPEPEQADDEDGEAKDGAGADGEPDGAADAPASTPARPSVKASARATAPVPARGGAHAAGGAHAHGGSAAFGEHSSWTLTPGSVAAYSADAARERAAQERAGRRKRAKLFFLVLLIAVLAIALILGAILGYQRWGIHDDATDIQGTWAISGEMASGYDVATIRITEKTIILDVDTTYVYTLDSGKKVIDFAFPPMDLEGQGHYRFSEDRNTVVIVDGKFSWIGTCVEDFWWQIRCFMADQLHLERPALGPTENATWLVRVSGPPQPAAEEAEAAGEDEGADEGEPADEGEDAAEDEAA